MISAFNRINRVKRLCRTNFNGMWELDHASYEGGWEEQDAEFCELVSNIIGSINSAIGEKNGGD